jgi:AcrR family transcriptional regulator
MTMSAGDPRSESARSATRAARRLQLLDAAVEAIRRHGPAATMEQLAAAGSVTKPILYRHFGDRDGLIRAIGHRFAVELLESVQSTLSAEMGARARLRHSVDGYLAFLERDPNLYRFLMQQRMERPALVTDEGGGALLDEIARQVTSVIGEQLRASGLDAAPAEPWGYGIIGLVHFAGDWWLEHRSMPRNQLTDYVTTLLWDGFHGLTADMQASANASTRSS